MTTLIGYGEIARLNSLLGDTRHLLLVTGNKSYEQSGACEAIKPALEGRHVYRFHGFKHNPDLSDVEQGIQMLRQHAPDAIVAVGGGSVMDIAKAVNLLAAQHHAEPSQVLANQSLIQHGGLPLVAIPTTAGSGSEATRFAVVYVNGEKHSLDHPFVRPAHAIVDSALSEKLPPRITAISGFDALSQAIESFWSVDATNTSQQLAESSIRRLWPALKDAVNFPDPKLRNAMASGAHLAGRAIDISRTTACHAVSYPLTVHHDVPHGHAVALTLGEFFILNSSPDAVTVGERNAAELTRLLTRLYHLMDCDDAHQASAALYDLMADIGLETRLGQVGVNSGRHLDRIVEQTNPARLANNPVVVTETALRTLLESRL